MVHTWLCTMVVSVHGCVCNLGWINGRQHERDWAISKASRTCHAHSHMSIPLPFLSLSHLRHSTLAFAGIYTVAHTAGCADLIKLLVLAGSHDALAKPLSAVGFIQPASRYCLSPCSFPGGLRQMLTSWHLAAVSPFELACTRNGL